MEKVPYDLKTLLIDDEGISTKPYLDTSDPPRWTIGVGRNLNSVGLSEDECHHLCDNDIARVTLEAGQGLPWFASLDRVRQDVVLSLVFNMGLKKMSTFYQMIDAIKAGDFKRASEQLVQSRWAVQVKEHRAKRLAYMMETGKYPDVQAAFLPEV